MAYPFECIIYILNVLCRSIDFQNPCTIFWKRKEFQIHPYGHCSFQWPNISRWYGDSYMSLVIVNIRRRRRWSLGQAATSNNFNHRAWTALLKFYMVLWKHKLCYCVKWKWTYFHWFHCRDTNDSWKRTHSIDSVETNSHNWFSSLWH